MLSPIQKFVHEYIHSDENGTFKKILLSLPLPDSSLRHITQIDKSIHTLKKIRIEKVIVKHEEKFSCVFEYGTKTITKNYFPKNAYDIMEKEFLPLFKNAILYTQSNDFRLSYNKKNKPKFSKGKATLKVSSSPSHNKTKKRYIDIKNSIYLEALGIVNKKGEISPKMQSKFKQINKYLETIDAIIKKLKREQKQTINIVDMGSGKGYLTFAMYDYLVNTLKLNVSITGVELRTELVNICTNIAQKSGFSGLHFVAQNIENYTSEKIDILIALHACDTATDDALYKGITKNAQVIITAPCCHKQIRSELHIENELSSITDYGILKERQAEILTDTLRGLVLQEKGYKTKIFEFIADAHTHKNIMIVATKQNKPYISSPAYAKTKKEIAEKKESLKNVFGVERFYLDEVFKESLQNGSKFERKEVNA